MKSLLILLFSCELYATQPDQKNLPIGLASFEEDTPLREGPLTEPPVGPVISLAEWEVSDGVMVLWPNPSLLRSLHANGRVYLLADSGSEKDWWTLWLNSNSISTEGIQYFIVPTDSIWIRDYGPWFILDGNKNFGIVDTKYNRPRPKDDQVPIFLANEMEIPYYQPGLVHTGGNYYNDALGNAFSSTLVFSENPDLSKETVLDRMLNFLGIERYMTSRLSPGSTIQHLDTFGKLVAPDTWVFSEFPSGSQHKTDSENMVALLRTLKSPYGTPYRIHRLKMTTHSNGDFRAYLNSFISNGVLYYPKYGDSMDLEVRDIYQKALPGYKIVGVDALGTSWGDSVHCRTRNLLSRNALHLFPHVTQLAVRGQKILKISLEAVPSPGAAIVSPPTLSFSVNGGEVSTLSFEWVEKNHWRLELKEVKGGDRVKAWVTAQDSKGVQRTEPRFAPEQQIEIDITNASL